MKKVVKLNNFLGPYASYDAKIRSLSYIWINNLILTLSFKNVAYKLNFQ